MFDFICKAWNIRSTITLYVADEMSFCACVQVGFEKQRQSIPYETETETIHRYIYELKQSKIQDGIGIRRP